MEVKGNYKYRVVFETEILVNREQEYIRKKKRNDLSVEEYESAFDELDFIDAMRWVHDTTTSFYVNTIEEVTDRISFEFHNGRIDITPMVDGGYFYWFDNNCLVNQERIMHRMHISVCYASDVEITENDMREIVKVATTDDENKED